jgi:hypothetical protein
MIEKRSEMISFLGNSSIKNKPLLPLSSIIYSGVSSDGAGAPNALDNMQGSMELVQGHKIRIYLIQLWAV